MSAIEAPALRIEALYDAHAADVTRWVGNLAGPSADREDLVHDVFVIAIRQWPRFRGEARPTTWLYRIALNVVRNHRRRQRLRRWVALDDDHPVTSPVRAADEALAGDQERQLVYRVLDRLNERQRTVIILFEIDERSGQEIAEIMGAKVATIWVWLHRAREAFVRELARVRAEEGR